MTTFFVPSPADSVRSIFVDHGPIAKAPLTLGSGSGASLIDSVTASLPGGVVSTHMLGKYLRLSGTSLNGGSYRISAILSPTSVRLDASFMIPDASNGSIGWVIYDPRNGQIADSPSDVSVTINSVPVTPVAVVGLLGQIVLSTAPNPGDSVKVSYSWVNNPTVYMVRLNSPEFRLNAWNRNRGIGTHSPRRYRYNNVLLNPSDFTSTDIQAVLDQPLQRDIKYRVYERAYTPSLNDPNLLRLNAPINKVAFPPLSREIQATLVSYGATVLPENDLVPWTRTGHGTASLADDFLTVVKTASGPFPTGEVLYWSQVIDLTFPHILAIAWRGFVTQTVPTEGVFTGVVVGYSDDHRVVVIGFLIDGGVAKIGVMVKGGGNDPSVLSAWSGGVDSHGNPTGVPADFDWTTIHSFRLLQDLSGTIRVYVDGDVNETLRITEDQVPFLEELSAPFTEVQGVFFGSLSRMASSTSTWNFVRYNILPTNPFQVAPSVFVNYEATMTPPETDHQPWTPVGYAGTELIFNANYLILDSTSASTLGTDKQTGLIGGDFRGYDRIEPLLAASSDVVLDVGVQLRTFTHGITPNAVTAAIDDGNQLVQLSFFPDLAAPKISYGGRSLPTQFQPFVWQSMGSQSGSMVGRTLRITDGSVNDGLLYFIEDAASLTSPSRVVSPNNDYILEFRVLVRSFTADVTTHFCGVSADVYDGVRDVGLMLTQISGVFNVTFHSEGNSVSSFPFSWNDGEAHTYRLVKSTSGNLVSVFVDTVFIGSVAYSSFSTPGASSIGVITFGSATPSSITSTSTVDWIYCNTWRVLSTFKKYVGIWKGTASGDLTDFHLPLKVSGTNATVSNNALGDASVNFIATGVSVGDYLVVDVGPNKGAYSIVSVSQNTLTIGSSFPISHTLMGYRIPSETDWTQPHRYRLVRVPSGGISVLFDSQSEPLIQIGYNEKDLPQSSVGVPRVVNGSLPSIVFGTFDPTNISQTSWDFVRYGITRTPTGRKIAPHRQFLNQRNVMASPEHLFTSIPHTHTDFLSSSTGIPPEIAPDFLRDPNLVAYTLLNEGTPLVPSTQTFEVRHPTIQQVFVGGLNSIDNVLNNPSFVLNNDTVETKLVVPDDVIYNSLQVIERDTGEAGLLTSLDDRLESIGTLSLQNTVCLTYDGNTLPENDPTAATPWSFVADDPSHTSRSAFNGVLTFGTDSTGTRTAYKNNTPLPDSVSLVTQVTYRLKVLSDTTFGLGDSQIRFGLSAPGMTLSMGFVTTSLGDRYVLVFDQNSKKIVGSRKHDFLDGQFHAYRLVRNPGTSTLAIFIDS